jgi:glycosyltransferase involved in cell wall biosynthesis
VSSVSVVVPTTGDRGELVIHAVGSALTQTVTDLEVLIVGDGVSDAARAHIEALRASDERIRFFDHPKHPRRGEEYRHVVLAEEATGDVVAYLCDRDLWLPNHLEELSRVLADADFGHTLRFTIGEDDRPRAPATVDLRQPADRARAAYSTNVLPLSMAGHTLAMYRRLPFGWRTTPTDRPTDRHMWTQFLDHPECRVGSSALPTVLSLKRPADWTTGQRLAVIERWEARMTEPGFLEDLTRGVLESATVDGSDLLRRLRHLQEPALGRWARRVLPDPVYLRVRRSARWVRRRLRGG